MGGPESDPHWNLGVGLDFFIRVDTECVQDLSCYPFSENPQTALIRINPEFYVLKTAQCEQGIRDNC